MQRLTFAEQRWLCSLALSNPARPEQLLRRLAGISSLALRRLSRLPHSLAAVVLRLRSVALSSLYVAWTGICNP